MQQSIEVKIQQTLDCIDQIKKVKLDSSLFEKIKKVMVVESETLLKKRA